MRYLRMTKQAFKRPGSNKLFHISIKLLQAMITTDFLTSKNGLIKCKLIKIS